MAVELRLKMDGSVLWRTHLFFAFYKNEKYIRRFGSGPENFIPLHDITSLTRNSEKMDSIQIVASPKLYNWLKNNNVKTVPQIKDRHLFEYLDVIFPSEAIKLGFELQWLN